MSRARQKRKLFPVHTCLTDTSFDPIKAIIEEDGRIKLCLGDLAKAFKYDVSIQRMRYICHDHYEIVEWTAGEKYDFINMHSMYLVAQGIAEIAAPAIERRIRTLAAQAKQDAFGLPVAGPFFDAPIEEDFG